MGKPLDKAVYVCMTASATAHLSKYKSHASNLVLASAARATASVHTSRGGFSSDRCSRAWLVCAFIFSYFVLCGVRRVWCVAHIVLHEAYGLGLSDGGLMTSGTLCVTRGTGAHGRMVRGTRCGSRRASCCVWRVVGGMASVACGVVYRVVSAPFASAAREAWHAARVCARLS